MLSDLNGTVVGMHPNVSSLKTNHYTITTSDYLIGVGALSSNITITLPISPSTWDQYLIKDVDGYAGQYSITVSGNGFNIDGIANFVLAQSFASISVTYTGSQWSVIFLYAGSNNGNGFGSFANRPIQGQSGRTYFAHDAGLMYFDDGNSWNPMGQIDYCTALKSSDFTWQNQSGATSTDFGSSILLYAPSNSNSQNVRFFYKNVPSTPYVITAKFIFAQGFSTVYGLAFGDGTKFINFVVNTNGNAWNLNVGTWSNITTPNSSLFDQNFFDVNDHLAWLRVADDGTNRSFSISRDGVNFINIYSTSSATYLTTSRVGIFLNPFGNDQYISFVSWKQS